MSMSNVCIRCDHIHLFCLQYAYFAFFHKLLLKFDIVNTNSCRIVHKVCLSNVHIRGDHVYMTCLHYACFPSVRKYFLNWKLYSIQRMRTRHANYIWWRAWDRYGTCVFVFRCCDVCKTYMVIFRISCVCVCRMYTDQRTSDTAAYRRYTSWTCTSYLIACSRQMSNTPIRYDLGTWDTLSCRSIINLVAYVRHIWNAYMKYDRIRETH